MFTGTEKVTHDNTPLALEYLINEVRQLRKEIKEHKEPQEWVTMGEAERITGFSKKTIVADRVENSDTYIPGTIRFKKINHTNVLYNRTDLLNWHK